jgi:TatA/E family protein of Tat protein translocase
MRACTGPQVGPAGRPADRSLWRVRGARGGGGEDEGVLSVPDMLVVSVLALLLFGPDRLPKIMRQAGRFMREVQSTSHSFVAEMERAAEIEEQPVTAPRGDAKE